jgi:hypothetical protein
VDRSVQTVERSVVMGMVEDWTGIFKPIVAHTSRPEKHTYAIVQVLNVTCLSSLEVFVLVNIISQVHPALKYRIPLQFFLYENLCLCVVEIKRKGNNKRDFNGLSIYRKNSALF